MFFLNLQITGQKIDQPWAISVVEETWARHLSHCCLEFSHRSPRYHQQGNNAAPSRGHHQTCYKNKLNQIASVTVHEVISPQLLQGPVAKSMVISTKEVVLTKGTKEVLVLTKLKAS